MHLYRCNIIDFGKNDVKQIGIIKEIDNLGRLQIPIDIRKRLGFEEKVELIVTESGLLIKSPEYHLVKKEKG